MHIIIDSREQLPFCFEHEKYNEATLQKGSLQVGDYSILGFEKELQRGRALDAFAVVVEASWLDLARGEYRSQLNPHAACQSVASFMARYGIPFLFAGSRTAAEYVVYSFLRQYLKGIEIVMKNIQKNIAV